MVIWLGKEVLMASIVGTLFPRDVFRTFGYHSDFEKTYIRGIPGIELTLC